MSETEDKRGPGLKFPPPVLVIAVIGCGYLVEQFLPFPIVNGQSSWWPGLALIVLALIIAAASLIQFLRAKTHVEPWQPTTTIIRRGLFRFSRNPIYLAFCIATIGCGLVLNSAWIVIAVLPLIVLLQKLVITREEAYLEQKFGDHYLDYKRQVRRWL